MSDERILSLDDEPTRGFGRLLRVRGIALLGLIDDRTAEEVGVELDRLYAAAEGATS